MHSTKSESPSTLGSPSAAKALLLASRPRTWIASISPVLIGVVLAAKEGPLQWPLFFLTLFFALIIQIGTNFANDYFDFLNGADTSERIGPKRATQQGWLSPSTMLRAILFTFALASLIALPLMLRAGWWSFPVTAFCILFGLLYTGGPKPLGYLGLGELLVLIFFGPVATCGTYFLQTSSCPSSVFLASLSPGLLSCSLLIANNLRDEKTDRKAKKNTLIVRFGRRFGSYEYALSIDLAALIPLLLVIFYGAPLLLLLASLIAPLSFPLVKKAFSFESPLELLSVLKGSALLLIIYTALFCLGILW